MSFKNRWMISSRYDFQAHQQRSQRRCCFFQTALLWFQVLPDMSPALPGCFQAWRLPVTKLHFADGMQREACSSPSEGMRSRHTRQRHREHPAVSDGNSSCCWYLANIIEKVPTSCYFESPETDLHIAENACGIDYTHTWSPKRVHWLSKSQILHCSTSDHGCEDTLELNTGIARVRLLIRGIHTRVAPESRIHWLPATFHNSKWMDQCEVCDGSIETISISDPVDIVEAYSHIPSCYHCVQWHVRLYGRCDVSISLEEDPIEGGLVLHCEVSSTEAVQILRWSDSNDRLGSDFCTYPESLLEVAIVLKVGQGNGYSSRGREILYEPIPRGLSELCEESILCQTSTCACQ